MRKKTLNQILRGLVGLPGDPTPGQDPPGTPAGQAEARRRRTSAPGPVQPPAPADPPPGAGRIEWLPPQPPTPAMPRPAKPTKEESRIEWGGSSTGVFDFASLVGVEDAYDHTPLQPGEKVAFCSRDKVAFHLGTWEFLRSRNSGRCCICGRSGVIRTVTLPGVVKPEPAIPPPLRPAFPAYAGETISLKDVPAHLNMAVTVQDYVHRVHRSQKGTYFVRFEPLAASDPVYSGFKVVIFNDYTPRWTDEGLRIEDYARQHVRARGVVQEHPTWGIEILINSPRMIEIVDAGKSKAS